MPPRWRWLMCCLQEYSYDVDDLSRRHNTGWPTAHLQSRKEASDIFPRATMAAHTTLLDFHVAPTIIAEQCHDLKQKLENLLKNHLLEVVHSSNDKHGGFLIMLRGPRESHGTLRCYTPGLLTLTLEEYIDSHEGALFACESVLSEMEAAIRMLVQSFKTKRLPPIKRGGVIDPYASTSDDRLLEYDFDEMVYEALSPFQSIKIYHSISFGNLLVLDDLQNLAESDLIYTQTLMRYGELDYTNKTVLILGGGDGGLLHELLKEEPSFITMIEMVMEACKKYLRPVCGDCLDTYKGLNYEIIVDDCVKVMEKFVKENKNFDYVIGDLTDIPITPTPQGEFWDFIRKILDLAFRILAPSGRFLTHGNGVGSIRALEMYEQQLHNLHCPIEFKRYEAYVPSFMECWVFYEVWKKKNGETYANGNASLII